MQEQASSIGNIGSPNLDEANKRIKWFNTIPVYNEEELRREIVKFRKLTRTADISRVTARFFMLRRLAQSPQIAEYKEAEIPLEERFSDFSLVYLGWNLRTRRETRYLTEAELYMARLIDTAEGDISYDAAIERAVLNGFDIKAGTKLDVDLENILDLYREAYEGNYTFGLNTGNIRVLIENPRNIKAVVLDRDDKVVSIGVAEVCEIRIEGKPFRFVELSDAATYKKHANKGFYSAISSVLMKKLAEEDVDLVYGEARSAYIGVNIVCRRSGRRFFGLLNKHCKISGPKDFNEIGPYENLNVWAINGYTLRTLVSRCNHGS